AWGGSLFQCSKGYGFGQGGQVVGAGKWPQHHRIGAVGFFFIQTFNLNLSPVKSAANWQF
ncbi:hypothetical protein, partial [Pseudomonas juntendi]|uniref:hypothetical protein n=1 Tax=Pseudomonas juntendi TaxID=2666183 RepID=UPI001C3FD426